MENSFLTVLNVTTMTALAALHLYWVAGGRWGLNVTIPTDSNARPIFRPGRPGTFVVALALGTIGMLNLAFAGWLDLSLGKDHLVHALRIIGTLFLLRAIGDFRYVGFTKRYRQTAFAKKDSKWYSPLCLLIGIAHWMMTV